MVPALISLLAATNSLYIHQDVRNGVNQNIPIDIRGEGAVILRLLQQSILRALVAITESLPRFVHPFYDSLLAPTGLPSRALREQKDSVKTIAERLDLILASKGSTRHIVPATCDAIAQCLKVKADQSHWREAEITFGILRLSIREASRDNLSLTVNKIFGALVSAFSYEGATEARQDLLSTANDTFMALVMKLSEAQLRPVYARFREWRGEFDAENGDRSTAIRRYAFWSMSATLTKDLKGIFLPCLSSVVTDIVDELVSRKCFSYFLTSVFFLPYALLIF